MAKGFRRGRDGWHRTGLALLPLLLAATLFATPSVPLSAQGAWIFETRRVFDEFVKFSYRAEHRDGPDPSPEALHRWDATLHARYGAFIPDALAEHGIADTRRNRSILALLAQSSSGSGKAQVRRAAAYWKGVRTLTVG